MATNRSRERWSGGLATGPGENRSGSEESEGLATCALSGPGCIQTFPGWILRTQALSRAEGVAGGRVCVYPILGDCPGGGRS